MREQSFRGPNCCLIPNPYSLINPYSLNMGVVHKLTQEVIDFIVQLKKDNSAISCRQISTVVEEKFALHVSKSSVNNVLKKADLSSSVGRRSLSKDEEKQFKIPESKKKQLQDEMQKFKAFKQKETVPKGTIAAEKASGQKPKASHKKTHKQKRTEDKKPLLKPKDLRKWSDKAKREQKAFLASGSQTYNDFGEVLFKCAEWIVSDRPFISSVLQKLVEYYPIENDDVYNEIIINGIIVDDQIGFMPNQGLNRISSVDGKIVKNMQLAKRLEWIKTVAVSERSKLTLIGEITQLVTKISGYSVALSDGSEVFIDANYERLIAGPGHKKILAFHNRAIDDLSLFLVSSRKMPLFYGFDSPHDTEDDFDLFLKVFLGKDNTKIVRIGLLDEKGAEITGFSYVPKMKRSFAVGIWQNSALFARAVDGIKWQAKKEIYIPEIDQVLYFADSTVDAYDGALKLRRVVFWGENQDNPMGALIGRFDEAAEFVLKKYVLAWPGEFLNIEKMPDRSFFQETEAEIATLFESAKNFEDVYRLFVKIIEKQIKNHFSLNCSFSNIYKKSGHFYATDYALIIYLDNMQNTNNVQLLNMVNSAHIRDFSGRKILVFPSEKLN